MTAPSDPKAFAVGELVTRDGTDVHRVERGDNGYGQIEVVCLQAPASGWCAVGDVAWNLAGRYQRVSEVEAWRAAQLKAPKE